MTNDKEQGLTATPLPAIKLQNKNDDVCSEWVGLTKEDLETVHQELLSMSGGSFNTIAKAIEAKLREKNT